MDNRLVIPPWKVELVQRYFRKDKESLLRKDESISMVISEPGVQGFRNPDIEGLLKCRPKLTSKMKKPQGEGKDDVSSSRSKPFPVQSCPKIILDRRKFPRINVQSGKDQGKTCVSVILKLKSSQISAMRPKLDERIRSLKKLSSKYPVKYVGKSENSRQAEARLDFCFQSAGDARHFFWKVNNLFKAGAYHKIYAIMFDEESLGRIGLIFLLFSIVIYNVQATSIHQS